jgi:hypothetical protein
MLIQIIKNEKIKNKKKSHQIYWTLYKNQSL